MFGPLVHTSGTFGVLMSVFESRPLVLFDKFDPVQFTRKVVQFRPKFAALPPTALAMLLDSDGGKDDLASLLAVRSGTTPLPVATQERFEQKFRVPVLTNYGATEFTHSRCSDSPLMMEPMLAIARVINISRLRPYRSPSRRLQRCPLAPADNWSPASRR